MSRRVTSNQLASEIMNALKEYKEVTDDVVKQAVNTVSEETKKMIQSASPTDSGGYKKGWTAKKMKDSASKTEVVVYNRSKPGLTHLLEKGHAKRGGGRVEAKVHIAPAESYAISQLEDKIVKGLK